MKKLTVWLSTLIVAIIGVCCLVACGGRSEEHTSELQSQR